MLPIVLPAPCQPGPMFPLQLPVPATAPGVGDALRAQPGADPLPLAEGEWVLAANLGQPARLRLRAGAVEQEVGAGRGGILIVSGGAAGTLSGLNAGEGVVLRFRAGLLARIDLPGDLAAEAGELGRLTLVEADELGRHLCLALRAELRSDAGRDPYFRDTLALLLVTRALQRAVTEGDGADGVPVRLPGHKLRKVQAFMEANLAEAITLGDLAQVAGLSRHYFARSFKATVGCPPHRYLMERRLERCKQLLRETSLPLAQVALEVGFASQAHMTATFRRFFDSTPGQYRDGAPRR